MCILKPFHYTVIRVAPLRRKTQLFLLPSLAYCNVGILCGTINIQSMFDLSSHVWKYVVGYCSQSLLFAGFQLLKIVVFDLVDEERYHLYHTVPGRWIGRGAPSAYPLRSRDNLIEFFTDGVT